MRIFHFVGDAWLRLNGSVLCLIASNSHFVTDRARAIRQDFVCQGVRSPVVVDVLEQVNPFGGGRSQMKVWRCNFFVVCLPVGFRFVI